MKKLVDVLAREMKEWPEDATYVGQAGGGKLHINGFGGSLAFVRHTDETYTLPEGKPHYSGIVTREQWQAAKDELEKERMKPNKEGWIRHRGGKCPVEAGTLVDVRYRDGNYAYGQPALMSGDPDSGWATNWGHDSHPGDIMAWRPHVASTAVEPAVVANVESFNAQSEMPAAKYFDGPIQWRDRIHAIDAEQKAADEAHKLATEARANERDTLVKRLAEEGFSLIEPKTAVSEDMSDWRKWKPGDLLEMIDADLWWDMTNGKLYALLEPYDDNVFSVVDDAGNVREFNEFHMQGDASPALDFKWHSRPKHTN